ncbi:hypothetical protein EBZ80_04080 [bacterium]|nr:hypothetical protein [bacterium]
MTRIVDYAPSDEQTLVSRILLSVHQAADEVFSGSRVKERNQAKTVLSAQGAAGPANGPKIPSPPVINRVDVSDRSRQPAANSRPHDSAFSKIVDDSEFDQILAEKQKSRKWIFLIITLATAAFVALALLVGNRGLR